MNFLNLVEAVYREMGYSGTGPTTVVAQTGQTLKAVNAVLAADKEIQTSWVDWNFLWVEHTGTLAAATNVYGVVDVNWDTDSFYLDKDTDDYIKLTYMPWKDFAKQFNVGVIDTEVPSMISVKPNRSVVVDKNTDKAYSFYGEYWKRHVAMTNNDSQSLIPDAYRRVIVARAKMMLAEQEDAPEILTASSLEYEDIKDNLEANELPSQRIKRESQANEPIQVTVEDSDPWHE